MLIKRKVISAGEAYAIAKFKKRRLKEYEHLILPSAHYCYWYILEVLGGCRFPDAELTIMKSPKYGSLYAKRILKGPWSEAEPYIKRSILYYRRYKEWMNMLSTPEINNLN